jgi:hypothetical protein
MPRRRRAGLERLPTVWVSWTPEPGGPTLAALRLFLSAMDEVAAGDNPDPEGLAALMHGVYVAATYERTHEAGAHAG